MRFVASLLTACAILAGCSGPAPNPDVDDASAEPDVTAGLNETLVPERIARTLEIDFDGILGTYLQACVYPVGLCRNTPAVGAAEKSDLIIEQPGTNLTALSFNVTWEMTPATQTLAVGVMVMTTCEGCRSTSFDEVLDNSPLEINLSGLDIALNESAVIHVYVYNPTFFEFLPGDIGYVLASVEQSFHIEGIATVTAPSK